MKKIVAAFSVLALTFSFSGCWWDKSDDQGPQWSQEQLESYLNRESDAEMSYAGPFYFGNFEGFDQNSQNYSKQRSEKVDEIIEAIDSGIEILTKLDKKLKEEREIFAWYTQQIQTNDESTVYYTDRILRATNVNILSESLSDLIVLKKRAEQMEKDTVWGYTQFQKYGALIELTNMYTVEAASLTSRMTALYYLLEADQNTAYHDLNVDFVSKIDPVSEEVSDLLEELYYITAVAKYGEDLLFTADYYFTKDTVAKLDEQIAAAKKSISEYNGSNELLSEKMLELLKKKLQEMEDYRNNIVAYIDSIPAEELIVKNADSESGSARIIPVAYAQMDMPGYFQQKVKDAISLVKFTKNMSMAAVRVTGQQIKDLYDKSGAHEVVKDGAQIINGGLEIANSGVEVAVHGVQGIYYGDMTWADFKKKIENEKNELHDKFVQGKLGKEQYDELIHQVDQFQKNTGRFIENMSEFTGDLTGIISGQPQVGKFVKTVAKNVGNEAKKVLDTATDFSKNIAIIMHPETSKEDTRKAMLDLYTSLKGIKDDEGKLKDVELPDLKDLIKTETLKELGLTKEEEKEFVDQLKDIFEGELKKGESKDDKGTKKGKVDDKTVDAVHTILTNPDLTDDQIADLILGEITKGLPPINKDGDKKDEEEKNTKDKDEDGIEDKYDNCENTSNSEQRDTDMDSLGDACDPDCSGDGDNDEVCNELDNCPTTSNSDQADADSDGKGNVCDFDAPTLEEIAGTWPGSITVEEVYISDELRKQAEAEGCEIEDLEKSKGKKQTSSLTINPTGENGGYIIMSGSDMGEQKVPFTYENGVLKAQKNEEGASINIDMTFSGSKTTGDMKLDYLDGGAKVDVSMEFEK